MIYPAISIRQPWAALIMLGIKDVENRSWPLPDAYVDRPVLLHASKANFDPQSIEREARKRGMCTLPGDVRHVARTGHILGVITFGGCTHNTAPRHQDRIARVILGRSYRNSSLPSVWCEETSPYWWAIRSVRRLARPVPAPGRLRFWSFDLDAAIREEREAMQSAPNNNLVTDLRRRGIPEPESFLEAFVAVAGEALVRGEEIRLHPFGTLAVRRHSARMSPNPRTGVPMLIPARAEAHFRPGEKLRAALGPCKERRHG